MKKFNIKRLREFGGEWEAVRDGFGWKYRGTRFGAEYEIQKFAYLAPTYPGDDDTFVVVWHVYKNGTSVGRAKDPMWVLANVAREFITIHSMREREMLRRGRNID